MLDGDLAVNSGSWQWVAGTGTDVAPFFKNIQSSSAKREI